ncbi:MAG: hypothetical protein DCC66_08155 [Planctomycetota bacterium]|nr:MAG: hypothetical protein DCC66_08155 [Planctomycetota bacterium]
MLKLLRRTKYDLRAPDLRVRYCWLLADKCPARRWLRRQPRQETWFAHAQQVDLIAFLLALDDDPGRF